MTELRIHGVGGSPGPLLLGYEDPERAPILDRDAGPGIVVRQRLGRDGSVIQGFDWGSLNSHSRFQALWVFLLPFTLLNVAGWSLPRSHGGVHQKVTRLLHLEVVLLGWVLTATVALWIADLLISYLGYQWLPRMLAIEDGTRIIDLGGSWRVTLTPQLMRSLGGGLGTVLACAALIAAAVLAGRASHASHEPDKKAQAFTATSEMGQRTFFALRGSWAASTYVHLAIAFGLIVVVAAGAIGAARASSPPPRIEIAGDSLVLLGGVQLVLLAIFGLTAFAVRCMRSDPGPGIAWAFAVLAFALTNMFFSGILLWGIKYLTNDLTSPGQLEVEPGNELAIVDAYFVVIALWAVVVAVLALHRGRIRGVSTACDPASVIREEWVKPVGRAQGTARIIHKLDWLLIALGAVFLTVGAIFGLGRAGVFGGELRIHEAPDSSGLAYTAAAWLLPASALFVMIRVRKAASDNRARRFIGQAWDTLSFWPRRFHPFAVRPYSNIVVPALREHIAWCLRSGRVVLSAHSQGSILALAALMSLTDPDLERIGLVTYGSPIGTLYRRGFAAYFGIEPMDVVRGRLGGGEGRYWENLYRLTDPVGGPLLGEQEDQCVPDPAIEPARLDPLEPPAERDREPWVGLAIHSEYLKERLVKAAVGDMKLRLDSTIANSKHGPL